MSITLDIQKRVAAIEIEVNSVIKERADVVHGIFVALVGQQHVVILGPGGTAKSMLVKEVVNHIEGANLFKALLFETTPPEKVHGGPNIKLLAEEGRSRTVTDGMLPEADYAFLDEIFNANAPVLHSLHSIINERVFEDGDLEIEVPLRSLFAGTNKMTADTDPNLAPFFDRLHLRYTVDHLKSRQNRMDMVSEAIARMAQSGRRGAPLAASSTRVSLADLDLAYQEALGLNMSDEVYNTFLDIGEELKSEGIVISGRREVEGMVAVLANAWLRGHEDVQIADLDILAHMWWALAEQAPKAQDIVLAIANPSAKLALELMTTLDKIKSEYEACENLDPTVQTRARIECVRHTNELLKEAGEQLVVADGADTSLLTEVVGQAQAFVALAHRAVGL